MLSKLRLALARTRHASERFGRSPAAIWRELLQLRRLPGRLGVDEYFDYALADNQRWSWHEKQAFRGYASYPLYSRLNAPGSHALANDKVLFHGVMAAAGLAVPTIDAVYSPGGRRLAGATTCTDPDQLHVFLANEAAFPLFVKPADGVFGEGTHWVVSYDAERQMVHCRNERPASLSAFLAPYGWHLRYGLLFQPVVRPHPGMVAMCGHRVSSVRCLVLLADEGPRLLCANWKVPTGDNIVDNTGAWTNGNMVAAVDADTGEILSLWRGQDGHARAATLHPDTGIQLTGRYLPDWPALRQYVSCAAAQFPDLRLQAWDIVPSDSGVMSFEINLVTESTVFANQFVHGKGLLDERLRKALKLP